MDFNHNATSKEEQNEKLFSKDAELRNINFKKHLNIANIDQAIL